MKALAYVSLAIVAVVAGLSYDYYREFLALKNEIGRHTYLRISSDWKHHDTTLEDFGFSLHSAAWDFRIDVYETSRLRLPTDRPVAGLVIKWGEDLRGREIVDFNSPRWKTLGLPGIQDIAGFLKHRDPILTALTAQTAGEKSPASYPPWPAYPNHIHLVAKKKPGVKPAQSDKGN